jgi:hypothetical protein
MGQAEGAEGQRRGASPSPFPAGEQTFRLFMHATAPFGMEKGATGKPATPS